MKRTEIMEVLKYYMTQLENVERDAKDAGMTTEEITENLRKAIIEDLA